MNTNTKWKMTSYYEFTKDVPPYFVTVTPGFGRWVWVISDDKNNVIDSALYHGNAPTSEIDAKVKADRALEKLINNNN
jgi:hypothetical protein